MLLQAEQQAQSMEVDTAGVCNEDANSEISR